MGGGCVSDNYLKRFSFNISVSNDSIEIYHNINQLNNINKISNKKFHILSNIMGNNPENKGINKRYNDFHSFERSHFEKSSNLKNLGNKITNIDTKNISYNKNSSQNKSNFNEKIYQKINSNYNSSNLNGSTIFALSTLKQRDNIKNEEEKNREKISNSFNNNNQTFNSNNVNSFHGNNSKHYTIMKKIKENEDEMKKAESNINYNLDENNCMFINMSRGSSFLNTNEIEKFESPKLKIMIERENLDEATKGNKRIFSYFYKNKIKEKERKSQFNNIKIIKDVFSHSTNMSKYSEEMLNIINSIRTNPLNFIKDIDYLINNNIQKTEKGIFLISEDEKIKLMDNYIEIFEQIKNSFKKTIYSNSNLEKMKYNDDLEIIFDESLYEDIIENENIEIDIKDIPSKLNYIYNDNGIDDDIDIDYEDNEIDIDKINEKINIIDFENENKIYDVNKDKTKKIIKNNNIENDINFKIKNNKKRKNNNNICLDLNDDKIANLILEKRKKIKNKYPNNIFKMSIIKDIKINILSQIALEEFSKDKNKKSLKEIIFGPQYKYFAVSWTNEINRNFISISCFA